MAIARSFCRPNAPTPIRPLFILLIAVLTAWLSVAARAEPIRLKLSFFGSTQTETYRFGIKPFVDGVNADGKDIVQIDVYPNGVLGRMAEQPALVLSGDIDIAFIQPALTPYRFTDNAALELPGLFQNARQGTLVYTHLTERGLLNGYRDFVVIGAYAPAPTIIHSQKPINKLADLAGLKIRTNNNMEAEAFSLLNTQPTVMPISNVAAAFEKGIIDAAALGPNAMFEFDLPPSVHYHYFLAASVAPITVLMSRKTFDALPDTAKTIIRKYSGMRAAQTWIQSYGAAENLALNRIKSNPAMVVVYPNAADLASAQRVFRNVTNAWVAQSDRHRELYAIVQQELQRVGPQP